VTRVYLPHKLTARYDQVDMTLNAVTDRHLTLGFLAYRAPTELMMPPTENCYHINLTVAGQTYASRSDGSRETTVANERGVVLSPIQYNTVHWRSDAEQLILKVPRSSLETHLSELIGQPVTEVIDFDFGLDLISPAGRSLLNSVKFLADELDRPGGLAEMSLARKELEAFVMTQALHASRHQFTDALLAPAKTVRLGWLAPVIAYMEANADEPLTPQDLARVGCMSVRTLHASFKKLIGESPMSFLRRLRLDRVRAELLHSDSAQVRVTDVAMRWGFLHPSRFAQQYRDRFGEPPSATLRL